MTSRYEAMRKSVRTWTRSGLLINKKACLFLCSPAPQRSRNPRIPTPAEVINLKSIAWRIWVLFQSLRHMSKANFVFHHFDIVYSLTCTKVIFTGLVLLNQQINIESQQQNKSLTFSLESSNMFSNGMPNYYHFLSPLFTCLLKWLDSLTSRSVWVRWKHP